MKKKFMYFMKLPKCVSCLSQWGFFPNAPGPPRRTLLRELLVTHTTSVQVSVTATVGKNAASEILSQILVIDNQPLLCPVVDLITE